MSGASGWRALGLRWAKFSGVGALGILVQIACLATLVDGLHLNYLVSTAVAVEVAVVQNFAWHERFTWSDRAGGSRMEVVCRLLRFNLSNGAISILGNLGLMRLLVGWWGVPYLAANLKTIAALSGGNFAVSHWFVFRVRRG
jgi:dolichol-phosphate mannosyltransferase